MASIEQRTQRRWRHRYAGALPTYIQECSSAHTVHDRAAQAHAQATADEITAPPRTWPRPPPATRRRRAARARAC
eukprot:2723438-Prymnesium_polylepis.1